MGADLCDGGTVGLIVCETGADEILALVRDLRLLGEANLPSIQDGAIAQESVL